ncbi:Hypothetical protein CINCED_3A003920 [Cinara cedri]|uniref:Reverse transcriptase domain n=1 Tax=Cinara cedri TaxID=506608 RepID=A0A5E4NAI0_9HEMI|nr:Hypothetical protein CINCED_3A003920 [Cinara cedri]
MTRQYEKRNNIEIQQLYKEPDIVAVLKNRRMAWAGHVWRSNGLMKEVLKWKPQGKRPLGRPKQRWIDKVEKNLAEIGIRDGETIAQDRDRWSNILEFWRNYCQKLYTDPDEHIGNGITYGEQEPGILSEEIEQAVSRLKNNKAPGSDEITAEMLKLSGDKGVKILWKLCNEVWTTGAWPEDWVESIFIPLHKKGSTEDCSN